MLQEIPTYPKWINFYLILENMYLVKTVAFNQR